MGNSGLQNSNHKYWAYLIKEKKCSLQCSLLTWLCWLESHQIFPRPYPFHSSHFLIKRKEYLRDLHSTVRKRQSEIVFLSTCHVDETRGHGAGLFYTHRLWEGKKRTLVKPAPAQVRSKKAHHYYVLLLPSARTLPSRPLSNNLCVSEQARFHSSPAQYFISRTKREKKRNVWELRKETDQSVWETWQM